MRGHSCRRTSPAATESAFSLVELLAVLAIAALLLLIALPGYRASLHKARRAEAMSALLEVATRQEQFMLDRGRYAASLRDLGYADLPVTSDGALYAISLHRCPEQTPADCYRLQAAPVPGGSQITDHRCLALTLTATGARGATGSHPGSCW